MNDKAPAADRGPDQALWALLKAAHGLEERIESALGAVGLSGAKFNVLSELAKAGGTLALGELATRVDCVRSNVTQLVDRLEADGLVRREADPTDRRSIRAALTAAGTAASRRGAERVAVVQKTFTAALSPAELATLGRVLAVLD
jgi:DNA-binding MarR family transcriptional regulator